MGQQLQAWRSATARAWLSMLIDAMAGLLARTAQQALRSVVGGRYARALSRPRRLAHQGFSLLTNLWNRAGLFARDLQPRPLAALDPPKSGFFVADVSRLSAPRPGAW